MKNFQEKLRPLKDRGRLRSLSLPSGIDLASNDYLGLACHSALREAAISFFENNEQIGSAGSRLLRGHTNHHQELEEFAAHFFAAPSALYFSSGYQANGALFGALCDRHDVIIYDEFVHASAREAIQNSHAKSIKVQHNDLNGYEDALKKSQQNLDEKSAGQIWIAVESLYSMDGDFAPLKDLHELCLKYNAMFIIDEAHATGVLGEKGRGCAYELISRHGYERIVTLHTCGKALGVAGGLICAKREVIDYMINAARGFIYSTAPLPVQAFLVQKSLEIVMSHTGEMLRQKLFYHCERAQQFFGGSGSHIVPIVVGGDAAAVGMAEMLQQNGFDIRAIRPPTVPEGTARLRLSLSAVMTDNTLDDFYAAYQTLEKSEAA